MDRYIGLDAHALGCALALHRAVSLTAPSAGRILVEGSISRSLAQESVVGFSTRTP